MLTIDELSTLYASPGRLAWNDLEVGVDPPFFIRESFMGGIDVARRVIGPRLDVAPGLIE